MNRLLVQIISAIVGLQIAIKLINGVSFSGDWETFLIAGAVLGLANFFIKPILDIITLPIRIITLGLFGLVVNMALIWGVEIFVPQLTIGGIIPLFWTSIVISITNIILPMLLKK